MGDSTMTTTGTSAAERVLQYGTTMVGQKAPGRGTCWDLPMQALKHAKAKTPHDIGKGLYVWGRKIDKLADAQPGDILQFSGVIVHHEWITVDRKSGQKVKEERWYTFADKHSAIVERVESGMWFTTLNTHITGSNGKVVRLRMNLSPENIQKGKIQVYRPTEGTATAH